MPLNAILDKLEGIPEALHTYYVEKDNKFYLDVEDDVKDLPKVKSLKVALDRQMAEKKTIQAKLEELQTKLAEFPEAFDPEEFARLVDAEQKRKKKSKPGDEDDEQAQKKLFEQRIASAEKKHGEVLAAMEAEKAKLIAQIEKLVADEGLTKALIASGVDKKLMAGAAALLRKSIKVKKEGDDYLGFFETDLGETPINEFVENWSQSDEGMIYIAKPKGGDGKGGDGQRMNGYNPWDAQGGKVKPNLTKQQEMIVANPDRARQFAQAAGITPTW